MSSHDPSDSPERNDCPKCEAPAGSPCRTCGGKTATKYHTPRFILVPALRGELEVLVPEDRGPGGRGSLARPPRPPRRSRLRSRSGSGTPAARPPSRNSRANSTSSPAPSASGSSPRRSPLE
ncbi:zinc finger domain-containing protein [Streptomyces sp. NPDC002559]